MSQQPGDVFHCPLCGGPNACGIAAGDATCWCFTTKVPRELLERVPEDQKGIVCICRTCINGFKEEEKEAG